MDGEARIEAEDLLAERGWVERLAHGLVRDPGAADDVVQDAWVVALQRPPRRRDALRPWLARVVTNLVRQRRRGEERRAHREEVVALDEPFRRAVLLRYFHGLSSAEIAQRSGVPAGSVRSQVRRGLERLRDRLDQGYGDQSVWSCTLAGLVDGIHATVTPPIVGGADAPVGELPAPPPIPPVAPRMLVMKGLVLNVMVAVVAVGGIGTVFLMDRAETSAEPELIERTVDAAAPGDAPAEPEVEALVPNVSGAARAVVAAEPVEPGSAASSDEQQPSAATILVDARIVDERGRPVSGATLQLGAVSVASAADGRILLDAGTRARAANELLVVRAASMADHYENVLLRPGRPLHLGNVVLTRGAAIEGFVVDRTGRGIGGLQVRATGLETGRRDPEEQRRLGPRLTLPVPSTSTAEDGSFRLDSVPAGSVRLWAGGGDFAWSNFGPVALFAGETSSGVALTVAPLRDDDWITGIVHSPDGEPLVGMGVSYRYYAARLGSGGRETTDEGGRFRILVEHRVPHDITVMDPELRWSRVYRDGAEPGCDEIELRFEPARWVEVGVVDAQSEPVTTFQVEARSTGRNSLGLYSWVIGREHEDGVAELMLPTRPFMLVVTARGFEVWSEGPFEPDHMPEQKLVELLPMPGLSGRVLGPDGDSLAGATVQLCQIFGAGSLVWTNGFRTFEEVQPWGENTTTAADGSFVLYAREQEQYTIRVEAPGFAPTCFGPIELGPDEARAGVEIQMLRGGSIEGRVLVAEGVDPAGVIVGINRGDGQPRSARVASDGSYRFERLTPGPWEVVEIDDEIHAGMLMTSYGPANGTEIEWSCEVGEGETTYYDIDFEGRATAVVLGSLRLGDHDLAGWMARLERGFVQPDVVSSMPVAPDGTFRLEAAPGACRLVLMSPADSAARLEIGSDLILEDGTRDWAFESEVGRLSGAGAPSTSGAETFLEYLWQDGEVEAIVRIVPDEFGRFELPLVPVGAGLVRGKTPDAARGHQPWEVLARFEVEAGETEHVLLP